MPRKPPSPPLADLLRERDRKIGALESALFAARQALVGLMPPPVRDDLHAAWRCETKPDVFRWSFWAADRIMGHAVRMPDNPGRAFCPMCGGGSGSGEGGYSVPVGLERHLAGTHGVHRCPVFAAAFDMAYDRIVDEETPGRPRLQSHGEPRPKPWELPSPAPVRFESANPSANVLTLVPRENGPKG